MPVTLIILALIALVACVGLGAALTAPKDLGSDDDGDRRFLGFVVFTVFTAIFATGFLLNSVKLIGANEVGVKVTFGSVDQKPLLSGLHWVAPWVEVETLPTRPKTFTVTANTRSSENGIITTKLSARWATDKANAADLYLQVRTGDEAEIEYALLSPNMIGATGAYLGGKTNLDIINGTNWVANGSGIETLARTYLAKYGVSIDTVRVISTNPDKDTDANIRRASAIIVEKNIAEQANDVAIAQAKRNLTEANGYKDAADRSHPNPAEPVVSASLGAADEQKHREGHQHVRSALRHRRRPHHHHDQITRDRSCQPHRKRFRATPTANAYTRASPYRNGCGRTRTPRSVPPRSPKRSTGACRRSTGRSPGW
jgi:regulator of protease activity HflC (stomatin/prohibitin superfamily)